MCLMQQSLCSFLRLQEKRNFLWMTAGCWNRGEVKQECLLRSICIRECLMTGSSCFRNSLNRRTRIMFWQNFLRRTNSWITVLKGEPENKKDTSGLFFGDGGRLRRPNLRPWLCRLCAGAGGAERFRNKISLYEKPSGCVLLTRELEGFFAA